MDARDPIAALRPWIADATLIRPDGDVSLLRSGGDLPRTPPDTELPRVPPGADLPLVSPSADLPLVHLPDPATALVYRRTGTRGGDLRVIGPRSRAAYFPGKHLPLCVRIRFSPGAAGRVLGVTAGELRDGSMALADVWGARARRLEAELGELAGPVPILRGIEAALLDGLGDGPGDPTDPRDRLLHAAVASLSTTDERFAALARRLAVSERRLRDLFTERVGLPPKRFARVQRVRTVLAGADSARWARLAADSGYYDQSHMAADFHRLMGVSPTAFRAGRTPPPTPCATP